MPLEVLYQHEDFILINKPSGLPAHPGANQNEVTLLDSYPQFHLLNRLDKETSGIILMTSKTGLVPKLSEALSAPEAKKIYRALLRGTWKYESPKTQWDWPLSDKAEGRRNPQGLAQDRKPARTEVELVHKSEHLSEVLCQIKTGRQHQIRKHAALAQHPIVGDPRYNDIKYNQKLTTILGTPRLFLHAEYLEFFWKNQKIIVSAPLELDFKKTILNLFQPPV